jgi:hypothetical protein
LSLQFENVTSTNRFLLSQQYLFASSFARNKNNDYTKPTRNGKVMLIKLNIYDNIDEGSKHVEEFKGLQFCPCVFNI